MIYKIIGNIVKHISGQVEETFTKTYVEAKHEDEAELKALNLGFTNPDVSEFCNGGIHVTY